MSANITQMTDNKNVLKKIYKHFLIILPIAFILAEILSKYFWIKYTTACHTVSELVCIFIAISTFFIVWHAYDYSSFTNCTISMGFLAIAVFDIFHISYFPGLNLYTAIHIDQHIFYRIFDSFTNALILLVCSLNPRLKINRWRGVLLAATFASCISYIILLYSNLPELVTKQYTSFVRIVFEFLIFASLGTGLFNLKNKVADPDIVFRYIFLALLVAMSSELCFILSNLENSFHTTLGYILKATFYYILFRGIMASTLTVRNAQNNIKFEQQKIRQQENMPISSKVTTEIMYEIREHITLIKGFSQIIKSSLQDEQIKKYACIIENRANEVNKLINYFLTHMKL